MRRNCYTSELPVKNSDIAIICSDPDFMKKRIKLATNDVLDNFTVQIENLLYFYFLFI